MKAKMIISLTVTCLLSAALLTAVYNTTAPKIEQDRLKKVKGNLISTVFPEMLKYEVYGEDTLFSGVYDSSGNIIDIVQFQALLPDTLWVIMDTSFNKHGVVFKVFPRGYSGEIEVLVALGTDTTLLGIRTQTPAEGLKETPGLGTKITDSWFKQQFIRKAGRDVLLKKDGGSLDAITAATISSRAVVNGVREGIEKYKRYLVDE